MKALVAGGGFEPPTFDFIKSSASSDLSTLGSANDQGLGRKEAEHVDYRLRLSPERTANRMGRYGNWRVRRAPADTPRWGGRPVLPRAEEKRIQRARRDGGVRRKRGLWTEKGRAQLESLPLPPWTTRRRQELLELLDRFDPSIDQLSQAIAQEAARVPEVQRLQTHPGVGPITALAFVLVLGTPCRFGCGKQVASYLGLIPCEDSSADSWRLGHISKQGMRCFGS